MADERSGGGIVLGGSGGVLRRRVMPQVWWVLLALLVGGAIVWPIVQLEWRAFADGGSAFSRMLALPRFGTTMRITIILAVASSVLAVCIGTFLAWCAVMLPARVRRVGQLIPLLPLLIPAAAAVIGWIFMLSPKVGYVNKLLRMLPLLDQLDEGPFDIYTVPFIIIITALLLASFVYLFVLTGLQNMGQELEAAAAASGASPFRRFFTITLPLLRPSIIFAGSVVFLLGMGQFTVPLLLGRTSGIDVLTTQMFYLVQNYPIDYGLGAALGFPILAVGIILVLWQKWLLREQRRYVVVSARTRHQPRETYWWAATVVFLYGLLTTLLPLVALMYVSVTPFWRGQFVTDNLTWRHWIAVFNDPLFMRAIWTSIQVSLLAVVIVGILGLACAMALLQSSSASRPVRAVIDFLVTLPMAIPASLMGFGLLFAYTGPPFPLYGTSAVLVVTYVTLMIGHATRLQFTTLVGIGQEFREASAACGGSPVRTLLLVTLPLARKGMAATGMLTFVLLFHEFSASMMVRSVRTQVVGSVMYDVLTGGVYAQVAVLSIIMVVVTIIGVFLAMWFGGTESLKKI